MKIKPWDDNEPGIVLPRLEEILRKHPQFSAVSETLTLEEATKLFTTIISAFKSGQLSSDELSIFGNHLFTFATNYPNSDLFDAALAASEIAFYIRCVPEGIVSFLQTVDDFYIKHKVKD